jgi:catechol 2,3-dioxygenase-like lactoylglutathione lyase family enzyme
MTRFHLSLNVSDLERSVGFYSALFGTAPAKRRADYAKFETDDPPLVLSLEPTPRPTGGPLNHLGFRMDDAAALVAVQERLERAGVRSQREEGVECCYARQTKFWATDPDGTLWEFYTFEGDLDHRGAGQSLDVIQAPPAGPAELRLEHLLHQPVPERLDAADGSAAEVRLRGSFNAPLTPEESARLLAEARRALRPGGRLFVHVLTGEARVADPSLPGAAGSVRFVPTLPDVLDSVGAAGFGGAKLLKYGETPCFVSGGVAMRETQIEAFA